MDNRIRLCLTNYTVNALSICNVHFFDVNTHCNMSTLFKLIYNIKPELTFYACY